ncbi:MAG: hypothetical protein HXY48_03060 [Ignavibacteriaceae bacterium]|nr:hypothetical protein [Ignavibacteriaceae bacterium]
MSNWTIIWATDVWLKAANEIGKQIKKVFLNLNKHSNTVGRLHKTKSEKLLLTNCFFISNAYYGTNVKKLLLH